MARIKGGAWWAAATVLGVLLTFAPAVAGQRTLAQRDTDRFFAPIRPLVVEALRAGRLPLWNPHEAAGKPLFAEGVHAVLHPVSLAGALLAPESVDFLILASLTLAALGAFVLARGLMASPPAAAAAGLAFGLSGYTVSMAGNLVFLVGLSSLPWQVAGARAAGAGHPLGPAAAALGCACAFLSGDAQLALVGAGLGLALAADAGGARGALRAVAGLAVGLLLAGVQLAATAELLPETLRAGPPAPHHLVKWALPPGRLLEWLVPGLVRGPLEAPPRAPSGEWLPIGFAESVYLGAPLLVAAALGALGARRAAAPAERRRAALLLGAAAALLWLALGHHLGARPLLDGLPLWGRFRYTEKLMGPLALCLALLAARGVDAFAAAPRGRARAVALGAAALVPGAALLALHLAPGWAAGALEAAFGGLGAHYQATLAAGLPHAVAGLAAVAAADLLAGPAPRVAALALLVGLAPAAAAGHAAALGDPAARRAPAMPLEVGADAPAPRLLQAGAPMANRAWGLAHGDAYAHAFAAQLAPSVNVGARVDALDAYCAFGPRRFTALQRALGPDGARHLRRYGLTHLVVPLPVEPARAPVVALASEGGALVERDEALGRELWAVPHRPWAFFAPRVEPAASREDALARVLGRIAAGDDATVVVEAPGPLPTAPGRVLAVERRAERVRLEAEAAGPALLVVQDAAWPGWTATVDGQPAPLLAADALVRAVPLPAGRHLVELAYRPAGVRLGLGLTAAGAALLLLLAVAGWRAARRSG